MAGRRSFDKRIRDEEKKPEKKGHWGRENKLPTEEGYRQRSRRF
jgi:hypothetical protein